MSNQFVDDKMQYIENDIDKIKLKTGMYISYVGEKGALHLCKEIIQNAIDEASNPKSPCKNIRIILDTLADSLSVEDDGRGIPEDDIPMEILCTKLNSGSKFTREQGGASSGENGVGNTCVNALSTTFEWTSCRGGMAHTIKFENGIKIDDITKKSKKDHGCIIKFSPSQKYLGKTAKIPKKGLKDWIDSISYFIPKDCKIEFEIYKGTELLERIKYKSKEISELLNSRVTDNILSSIYSFKGKRKNLEEDFQGQRKIKRELELEFAFQYSDTLEPWIDSFCNYVNTTSGGTHLNTVRECIWRYFMKKTNDSMTDKEKEKYKVLKVDIESGLNVVVNVFTDMQMQFVGQTKNEVSNDDLIDPIKDIANECLEKYFDVNKNALSNIIKIIKTNCKARIDASKIKTATIKEKVNKFDQFKFDKFTPCNNTGKQYKELHLCEGDSALGSLVDGRDPDTQAFLAFRGVGKNGFKADEGSILDNAEWKTYVTLLKTNFGPKFDLSKCYYDKIIIETDSDIDGHNITSMIGVFHALYLPELVKDGRLYKCMGPLYRIDDKNMPFVRDKREYVEAYQDKIIKNYSVIIPVLGDKAVSKEVFREFIYDTQEYGSELLRVSKHFGVNKYLIELVAAYLTMYYADKNIDELFENRDFVMKLSGVIQEKYPEVTIKNKQSLRGVVDGKFQSIKINNRFIKKISDLSIIYKKYGYTLKVKEKSGEYKNMSIGEFLDDSSKYTAKIISRFKGLGEANSKQLWETTLNPDTRVLIQLTMEDVEKDLKIFQKLHGISKEDALSRKEMMRGYKINRNDLDN